MGCVASKGPEPSTPAVSSGVSGNLDLSGGIMNSALWNRIEVDRSESEESGMVSSNGTDSQGIKSGNFNKHVEGELAAAGWPPWLSAVAREAIQGWLPLKAEAYEKLEKIGQGTYSSVFKARELETGRFVALKKIWFNNFEPESVRFMAREIVIMRQLNHPNIMKLDGLITSKLSCSIFLVFEYMEHDLAGLSSSPEIIFTESQVKCYMQQLLSGLQHCHSRGIIHRDIKCANLLVNNEGILKIADFGLSNFFNPANRQQLTSRVVTLWYRPPELLLGATEYELSVDMWSVGCVFAELFLKRPVLQGKTEVEQIHKIFKLCGSPSDEYWRKSRLPHETIFKPQQAYQCRLHETFRFLPENAYKLLESFLSIEPQKRSTAISALSSEYFRTIPYACDPSSLPKYHPNKEIDAKNREESLKEKLNSAPKPPEFVRRNPRSTRSQKSSVSSKLSRLEEPWLKAENMQKNGGRQNSARVNDEAGLLDVQQKEVIHSMNADQKVNLHYGTDNRFSAPLPADSSNGFTWAKKERENQASVRSHCKSHSKSSPKCDIPRILDSSNVLQSNNYIDPAVHTTKGDKLGFCAYSKVETPYEIERNLMVHQWVQLGHPEIDNLSHNSTDIKCNMDAFSSKPCNMGYKKPDDWVEFSVPLVFQPRKVDKLLQKHEQQLRQVVRGTWLQKDKVF